MDSYEKGGEGLWAGSSMGVVSGFVAKNGARVLYVGGVEVFGDGFAGESVECVLSSFGFFDSVVADLVCGLVGKRRSMHRSYRIWQRGRSRNRTC